MSLQRYAGSDLNKFSKTIQEYLDKRPLLPGQMVKYRLLNGVTNIDPKRQKGDEVLFPSVVAIPLKTSIYDPGYKNGEGKTVDAGTVQIGVVQSFDDKNKTPVFRGKYYIKVDKGSRGIFFLRGGIVDEMEVYEAIELSNANKSNPFRDQSAEAIFERVDEVAESKVRSNKRNFLFDSMDAIRRWTGDEIKTAAASYNLNTALEVDVLKDKLEEIAMADPEKFYSGINSPESKLKALIKIATDNELISYSAHENKWVSSTGETLALLDRKEGVNEIEQFVLFLKNSANGNEITARLQKMLRAKMTPEKEAA